MTSPMELPVERLVLEAIETVARSDIAERILKAAYLRGGIATVPPGGAPLHAFVRGPLREELDATLGEDVAAEVVVELLPLLTAVDVRRSRASMAPVGRRVPSKPAAPAVRQSPIIPVGAASDVGSADTTLAMSDVPRLAVVASRDAAARQRLTTALHGHAKVLAVESILEVAEAVAAVDAEIDLLVLDGRDLRSRVFTISFALVEVPTVRVAVLWRTTPEAKKALLAALEVGRSITVSEPKIDLVVFECLGVCLAGR